MAGCRGAGLIPLNGQIILDKLPHEPVSEAASSSPLTTVDSCKDSRALLRQTRQAKLMLKNDAPLDRGELWDIIECLERFGIAADTDRDLERATFTKWQDTAKFMAKQDKRRIGKGYGEVIDGKTLATLYKEQEEADFKRAQAAEKRRAKLAVVQAAPQQSTKGKRARVQLPAIIEVSDDDSVAWDSDASSSSSSDSTLSVITLATPLPSFRQVRTPNTPLSPLAGRSRRSSIRVPSTPSTPLSRMTRSRSKCI